MNKGFVIITDIGFHTTGPGSGGTVAFKLLVLAPDGSVVAGNVTGYADFAYAHNVQKVRAKLVDACQAVMNDPSLDVEILP